MRLCFELCLALGIEHPNRLGLSYRELSDWCDFWNASPWGDQREDRRMAAQTVSMLLPWLPERTEPPALAWPYEKAEEEIDLDASLAFFERVKQHGQNDQQAEHPRGDVREGRVSRGI